MRDLDAEAQRNTLTRDARYEVARTGLLLVDMQRLYAEPGHDPNGPRGAQAGYYYPRLRDTVVPNQQRLLGVAREAGLQVVHTLIRSLTEDGRDRSLDHKLSGMHVRPGDPLGEVIAELAPGPNEVVLPKTSSGVFNSTSIDYVLRNLGVRYLIVAGVLTDQCVDMAVRDAADRGYLVTLVDDACATYDETRHRAALDALAGYCHVTSTRAVLDRLRADTDDPVGGAVQPTPRRTPGRRRR